MNTEMKTDRQDRLTAAASLQLALDYIAKHPTRYLHPLHAGTKIAILTDYKVRASNDPAQLTKWAQKHPGCNWALGLGKSGIQPVDIDTKAGKVGAQTFADLEKTYGKFPPTEEVETPTGGRHLYYLGEHVFALGKSGFGEDIDSPQYVLIPGCKLDSTDGDYKRIDNGHEIQPAPAWFYGPEILGKAKERKENRIADVGELAVKELDTEYHVNLAIDFLSRDAEPAVSEKGGNNQTWKIAAQLRGRGISQLKAEELMAEFYNVRCEPPWEPHDLNKIIANAYQYATQERIGEKTAEAEFSTDNIDDEVAAIETKGTPEEIEAEVAERQRDADLGIKPMKPSQRTKVLWVESNLPRSLHDAMAALKRDTANGQVFQRGPDIVRINKNLKPEELTAEANRIERKRGSLVVREVDANFMFLRLSQAAAFYMVEKKMGRPKKAEEGAQPEAKEKPTYRAIGCPPDLVRAMMAAETLWDFDWLEGIIEAPTMDLGGTVLDKPGYDKASGLYYDPRNVPAMPKVKELPTAEDALAALAVIHDVLDEFAFEQDGGVSHSVAVSAILAACVRRVLPICPVILIDAPKQSNGKTLLADLIATIPTCRGAGATQWPNELAEQRKTITSILMAGDLVVNFDNVTASIGGPAICAVTTAQASYKDRILGRTEMAELPTGTLWLFTGNNMTVKDDMASRAVRIRLDAKCENPKDRVFKRKDLLGYVRERRGLLIHAALTIMKAYIVAGRPLVDVNGKSFTVPGRFNAFGEVVAAPLVWLGQPDPLKSQEGVVEDDPVREAQQTILGLWKEHHGFNKWLTAKELGGDFGVLKDAINAIEAGGSSQNATASKLKTFEGSIIDNMMIVSRPAKPNRPKAWRLVDCDLLFLE
jgi:hypothetical protein